MQFRYAILYVENVPNALSFYKKAFGFETLFLHESNDYGELSTGGTKLAFSSQALMHKLGKSPARANAQSPTFELAFETKDVQSGLEKALSAGAKLLQATRTEEWGQTTAYVTDPDGYTLEICSPIAS